MSFVLGLTGSIGSGKSMVATMIKSMTKAPVIDADLLARAELESPAMSLRLKQNFGADVITHNGSVDRRKLASRAFASAEKAQRLNDLIHPNVRSKINELIASHTQSPLIILDVPLLYESKIHALCNKVAVVTVNEAERFRRLRTRGFSEQEIIRRLAFQMPQSRKAAKADWVIENSGTPEQTCAQVKNLIEKIQEVKTIRS